MVLFQKHSEVLVDIGRDLHSSYVCVEASLHYMLMAKKLPIWLLQFLNSQHRHPKKGTTTSFFIFNPTSCVLENMNSI